MTYSVGKTINKLNILSFLTGGKLKTNRYKDDGSKHRKTKTTKKK